MVTRNTMIGIIIISIETRGIEAPKETGRGATQIKMCTIITMTIMVIT